MGTIPGKSNVTLKFTLARGDFAYFHLGRCLLRSARSPLDDLAFVSEDLVADVTVADPLTVQTSED